MLTDKEFQELRLRNALHLIKVHIDPTLTTKAPFQDADLHKAVGLIVDVAREYGMLKH